MEIFYFDFRLDIDVNKLNHVNKFIPVTVRRKMQPQIETEILVHPAKNLVKG